MFVSLKHPYISVAADGTASYGGNQMRSANGTERAVGCGLIAGLDLLLYLSRYHLQDTPDAAPLPFDGEAIPDERYWALVSSLRKKYLPLIPRHGINGLFLALGLNAWFLKHRFPFRAGAGTHHRTVFLHLHEAVPNGLRRSERIEIFCR